jgi:hypothetical protein
MPLPNDRSAVEPARWIAVLDRMEAALIQIRVASESKDAPIAPPEELNEEQAVNSWESGLAALTIHLEAMQTCAERAAGATAEIDRSLAHCESDLTLWWDDAARRKQQLAQACESPLLATVS